MKILAPILSIALISCSVIQRQEATAIYDEDIRAVSDLHSASQEKMIGLVKIKDYKDHFKIEVEVSGLKPNSKHGLHIHENGICEGPYYKTAGDHFNPYKHAHGRPDSKKRHIGDMGNIETDANGIGKNVIILPKQKMDDLNLIIGKSVLLHAGADDLKTQPSGNSGDRIACGLIKPVN